MLDLVRNGSDRLVLELCEDEVGIGAGLDKFWVLLGGQLESGPNLLAEAGAYEVQRGVGIVVGG